MKSLGPKTQSNLQDTTQLLFFKPFSYELSFYASLLPSPAIEKIMPRLISLISLFLVLASPVFAGNDSSLENTILSSHIINIEGEDFIFPTPEGNVAASEKMPELLAVFKQFFPENSTLYEAYASEENLDAILNGKTEALEKYYAVIQSPEIRNGKHSIKDIAVITAALKSNGDIMTSKNVTDKIDERVKKVNASLSEMAEEKVELKIDHLGFLGTFETSEKSAGFSIRAEVADKVKKENDTVMASSAFLLLGDKLVLLAVYSLEKKDLPKGTALLWTQGEISKWTKAILQANSDTVKSK
jgi:hypothetical protein